MATFYTILTDVGQAKLANAIALGQTIEITELAVGDGNGSLPTPETSRTTLINEVRRASINLSEVDGQNPNWVVVEQVLPPDVGGWTIREIGVFDVDGDLIGYGNYPETYKPILAEGSSRTQTIRFVMEVSDTEAITLKVDPSIVLATRGYADDLLEEHEQSNNHPLATKDSKGMVRFATQQEHINGERTDRATHPAGLRAAIDAAMLGSNLGDSELINGLETRVSPDRGSEILEISPGRALDETGTRLLSLSGGTYVDSTVSGERGIFEGNLEAETWYGVYLLGREDGSISVMALHQDTPVWMLPAEFVYRRLIGWSRIGTGNTWIHRICQEEGGSLAVWPEDETTESTRVVNAQDPSDQSWVCAPLHNFISPATTSCILGVSARQTSPGSRAVIRARGAGSRFVPYDPSSLFINSFGGVSSSNPPDSDIRLYFSKNLHSQVLQGVRSLEWQSRFGTEAEQTTIDIIRCQESRRVPRTWDRYKRADYPFEGAQFCRFFYEAGTWYMYGMKFDGTGSSTTGQIHLWTSSDGITWSEHVNSPVLSPSASGWDETQVWSLNVVKVAAGDYRALYTGRDSSGANRIGYAYSDNPVGPWTKFAGNPVIAPDQAWEGNDTELGSIVVDGGTVYCWYHQVSDSPRQSGLATSNDWETWIKDANNPIFSGTATNPEYVESQQFSPGAFKWNGQFYQVISCYQANAWDTAAADGIMVLYRDSSPTFYPQDRERLGVIATATQKWETSGSRRVFDTFRTVIDGDSQEVASPLVVDGRLWAGYSAYNGITDNGRWACGMLNVPTDDKLLA
ncbi:phage tail protein [Marinobacter sp.]|uniref:phage tail-collar fiber domain-containing protein n=1 Tax=Marinobacter sp. TaxID=50741 RepID=UPI0035C6CA75